MPQVWLHAGGLHLLCCRCGCSPRPLPVMAASASTLPPLCGHVTPAARSCKRLWLWSCASLIITTSTAAKERSEPTEQPGTVTIRGAGRHGGPPLKRKPDLSSLFSLDASQPLRASAEEGPPRRSSPFPSEGGGRRSSSSGGGGGGGSSRAGEVFSKVRAEWRTVRRRRYRWRSEPGLRSWSWSCQRVRH